VLIVRAAATEDYARVILTVEPGVTDDEVDARLAARLARQATLTLDHPPGLWFLGRSDQKVPAKSAGAQDCRSWI